MNRPDAKPVQQDAPETLLERYRRGDDTAFGELVARYEDKLFAFLARMTGDSHLAEDVFQQVFVKVAKNASLYDGRASFSTWLFRIARNAALDELRRRNRRPEAPAGERDLAGVADTHVETPLDRLTREELGRRMRAAIDALPEAQREAFLLKEEGDLDFGEIGAVLGCGRETAKSRFRLAVGKLRAVLGMDAPERRKAEER